MDGWMDGWMGRYVSRQLGNQTEDDTTLGPVQALQPYALLYSFYGPPKCT